MKMHRRREAGFTLLEIMLVVGIIVIILGVAVNKLGNTTGVAKDMAVRSGIQTISTQLRLYESINGFVPTTEQGLQALVVQPSTEPVPSRWYQLFQVLPQDPWNNNFIYLSPGRKNPTGYDLYSAGADRKPDTADDNWGN